MAIQLQEVMLSKTIEAQVLNNTSTIVKFDVNDTALDNMLVHGLHIINASYGIAPSGKPLLVNSALINGFITLVNDNNKVFNSSLPIDFFFKGNSTIKWIHPKLISVRNSFFELPRISVPIYDGLGALINVAPSSIVVTFFYKILDKSIHQLTETGELIV